MSTIVVRPMGKGLYVELHGVYPTVQPRLAGIDVGVTLTREEAVDLHGKLVTALWNVGVDPGCADLGASPQESEGSGG